MPARATCALALILCLGCQTERTEPMAVTANSAATAETHVDQSSSAAPAATVELSKASIADLEALIKSKVGKVVVVDFWSTSCEPCVKEFPGLVALHQKYGPDKLACVSFSVDFYGVGSPDDFRDDVLKFLRSQGATFDNLLSSDASDQVFKELEFDAPPAVYVFNQAGEAKRFDNSDRAKPPFTYERDVAPYVAQLLGGA